MKHLPKKSHSPFVQFSVACTCEVDRVIQDSHGVLYCGECMEPLERVESRELPEREQGEILTKLKMRTKIAAREGEGARELWTAGDEDEDL